MISIVISQRFIVLKLEIKNGPILFRWHWNDGPPLGSSLRVVSIPAATTNLRMSIFVKSSQGKGSRVKGCCHHAFHCCDCSAGILCQRGICEHMASTQRIDQRHGPGWRGKCEERGEMKASKCTNPYKNRAPAFAAFASSLLQASFSLWLTGPPRATPLPKLSTATMPLRFRTRPATTLRR
jgi:hypothetical protein